MIGCASLEGTDPEKLALPLSFLHHTSRAGGMAGQAPHEHRRVEMDRMPAAAIDARAALRSLPPLIKGYLRLGAFVGDGAVIDRQFGTTDVCDRAAGRGDQRPLRRLLRRGRRPLRAHACARREDAPLAAA